MGRCKKQPRKKYSQQQLFSALQAVKNGVSQFAAAKKFGIPRSTLFNKVSGKTLMGKKPGPNTVLLPEEECTIEKWVFGLAVRGFPVTKRQLLRSVQLYLNINKRNTIFKNNLPGRKWYDSFRERHPKISEKISQNLTIRRAAITPDKIRFWHAEILKYCEEHDLTDVLNDPSRVFNMDEKGFILTPNKEVVLVKRGDKAVYNRSKNDEKEVVTALLGGNASGKMTPPMMIHSYKRMPSAILLNNPAKWSVGISDSGWQTQTTFHDYMVNIFHKWLLEEKIQLPVIVFIDGHKSHVSLTLSDFCADNQIVLIALYPNSTHLTQPMDVGVFKPLNTSWTNQAKDWRVKHQYAKIEKKDVAPILEKAINGIKYSEHLKNAFKKSGIFPFNVDNIDLSRVLPSVAASVSSQEQLWNDVSEPNTVQAAKVDVKNAAVDRLTHFESLIGNCVLKSFRSSANVWTGSKEYSLLFTIWQQMYKECLESISQESSEPIILDVEEMTENINHDGVEHLPILDGDDGVWLLEGIDNSMIVEVDTTLVMGECALSVSSESNNIIDDHYNVDHPGNVVLVDGSHDDTVRENPADNGPLFVRPEDTIHEVNGNCAGRENGHPKITTIADSRICAPDESINNFNPTGFKEAFFWPVEDPKQTKKKETPKISSVMSSEDWREHERMKYEEKQQEQAAKDARKAAREAKKLQSTKMAAEKLILKTQKIAAAKKAAENKLSRNKNKSQIRKRSTATKVVKNSITK